MRTRILSHARTPTEIANAPKGYRGWPAMVGDAVIPHFGNVWIGRNLVDLLARIENHIDEGTLLQLAELTIDVFQARIDVRGTDNISVVFCVLVSLVKDGFECIWHLVLQIGRRAVRLVQLLLAVPR